MASLHALMREIGALRRSLETELTVTAAALEHGELAVADEVLGDSVRGVRAFERRGLAWLDATPPWPVPVTFIGPVPRAARRLRELAVAASVAALALVLQAAPASTNLSVSSSAPPEDLTVRASTVDLSQAIAELGRLYQGGAVPAVPEITAVADRLASQVNRMSVAQRTDIATATQAISALRTERVLLSASNTDGRLTALLVRNKSLTEQLTQTLNDTLQSLQDAVSPLTSPTADPTSAPTGMDGLLGGLTGLITGTTPD